MSNRKSKRTLRKVLREARREGNPVAKYMNTFNKPSATPKRRRERRHHQVLDEGFDESE